MQARDEEEPEAARGLALIATQRKEEAQAEARKAQEYILIADEKATVAAAAAAKAENLLENMERYLSDKNFSTWDICETQLMRGSSKACGHNYHQDGTKLATCPFLGRAKSLRYLAILRVGLQELALRTVADDLLRGPEARGERTNESPSIWEFPHPLSLETFVVPHFGLVPFAKVPTARTVAATAHLPSHPTHFSGATYEGSIMPSMDPSLPFLVKGRCEPRILIDQRRYGAWTEL